MATAETCEAAELVGERAITLLQLLQPWETQPESVRSVCVGLTMELARLARALAAEQVAG